MLTPIELIKATVDGMIARKFGRIVNITSSAVKAPIDILGLSNGARSGLTGFVAGVARKVARARRDDQQPAARQLRHRPPARRRCRAAPRPQGKSLEAAFAAARATRFRRGASAAPRSSAPSARSSAARTAGYIVGQNILLDGGAYPGTYLTMIDLYYWTTPNGHKITIFLEETGLPYTIKPINIGKGEQFAPEFLAISPNNRIPAIVDHAPPDGGAPLSLFESGAILLYLAGKTGRFYPADLRGRCECRAVAVLADGRAGADGRPEPPLRPLRAREDPVRDRPLREGDGPAVSRARQRLADREFIAGDYTIADMACYPWMRAASARGRTSTSFRISQRWLAAISGAAGGRARLRARQDGQRRADGPRREGRAQILFGQDQNTVR